MGWFYLPRFRWSRDLEWLVLCFLFIILELLSCTSILLVIVMCWYLVHVSLRYSWTSLWPFIWVLIHHDTRECIYIIMDWFITVCCWHLFLCCVMEITGTNVYLFSTWNCKHNALCRRVTYAWSPLTGLTVERELMPTLDNSPKDLEGIRWRWTRWKVGEEDFGSWRWDFPKSWIFPTPTPIYIPYQPCWMKTDLSSSTCRCWCN